MKNFLKGAFFVLITMPLLEGGLSIFNQSVELVCTKIATLTYQLKKSLEEEDEQQSTCAIGFQAPITEEENEEE